jgi:hypothetical protein
LQFLAEVSLQFLCSFSVSPSAGCFNAYWNLSKKVCVTSKQLQLRNLCSSSALSFHRLLPLMPTHCESLNRLVGVCDFKHLGLYLLAEKLP